MRILLGGVPFGCDNIGDEAILACVVELFRKNFHGAELGACTRDGEATAKKLGIATLPLYGFDLPSRQLGKVLGGYDLFVWCGATGLSDYPESACRLLDAARKAGVPAVVWSVGMNDRLNPAFFRLRGKKRTLCRVMQKFTAVDWTAICERRLLRRARGHIARSLGAARGVILRDARSLVELRKCAPFPEAVSGADSAIINRAAPFAELNLGDGEREFITAPGELVGVCVSAQSPIRESAEFTRWLDRLVEDGRRRILMIPMNPKSDYELMRDMQSRMKHADRTLLTRFVEPAQVQALAAQCDLIISSRLHLMIFALNELVPCIGIARGSKIDFFLDRFGLTTAGSTDRIDFEKLSLNTAAALADPGFKARAAEVRKTMLAELAAAEIHLRKLIG